MLIPPAPFIKRGFRGLLLLFMCLSMFSVTQGQSASVMPCPSTPATAFYPRQVWDMEVWDGGLLIGCGNASSTGVFPDAVTNGYIVTPLVYLKDGTLTNIPASDEQVGHIRLINGVPFVAGMDASDTAVAPSAQWDFGNLYRWASDGTFTKLRTIQNAQHVFDLASCLDNLLCAAISTSEGRAFGFSTDSGQTWKTLSIPANGIPYVPPPIKACPGVTYTPGRAWNVFNFNGATYVNFSGALLTVCTDPLVPYFLRYTLAKWNPDGSFTFIPTTLTQDRIERAVEFAGKLVALNAKVTNETQWNLPILAVADTDWTITLPALINCQRPQDIKVLGANLYLLCNQTVGTTQRVSIQTTTDLVTWVEISSLIEPTFGRSFAQLNGVWYIGLGTDTSASAAAKDASGLLITMGAA